MGIEVGTALLASALLSTAATATEIGIQQHYQHKAEGEAAKAGFEAEQKQKEADESAERKRLQALASNQTVTDYGNVWGVDSNKYADVAQKLSAGTGNFGIDDDEDNPFYTRGLL